MQAIVENRALQRPQSVQDGWIKEEVQQILKKCLIFFE
jgi:hypothetical protein